MHHQFTRAAGFLALLTAATLAACSGGSGTAPGMLPVTSSAIPSARTHAAHSVVVTVVNGGSKLAGVSAILFICTDSPNCMRRDKVLSRGKTNAKGQVTLKGSYSDAELVCADAIWEGSGFLKERSKCQNNFPNSVTINFAS